MHDRICVFSVCFCMSVWASAGCRVCVCVCVCVSVHASASKCVSQWMCVCVAAVFAFLRVCGI